MNAKTDKPKQHKKIESLLTSYKKTKDSKVLEELIKLYTPLVEGAAKRFCFGKRSNTNFNDFVQEGWVGFLRGVERYELNKGRNFTSYISEWVRALMLDYFFKNFKITKMPLTRKNKALFFAYFNKRKQILQSTGRDPIIYAAEKAGVSKEMAKEFFAFMEAQDATNPIVVEQMISDKKAITRDEMVDGIDTTTFQEFLDTIKPTLDKIDLAILEKRLLSEKRLTLCKIGMEFNITREAIRAREIKLIKKLRFQYLKFICMKGIDNARQIRQVGELEEV